MENTTAAASSFTTPWKLSVLELTGASAHHSCGSSSTMVWSTSGTSPAGMARWIQIHEGQPFLQHLMARLYAANLGLQLGEGLDPFPPMVFMACMGFLSFMTSFIVGFTWFFMVCLMALLEPFGVLHAWIFFINLSLTLGMATAAAVAQLEKPEMVVQSLGS